MDYDKAWYVLHTYSGYENKVKENLEMRRESMAMEDNIFDIMVPEEEVTERNDAGEENVKTVKTFPGYVLVEMIMSDEAWFVVRNTPGVTGFVGSHGAGSKPSPLLPDEVDVLLGKAPAPKPKTDLHVKIGDTVEITDGAFAGLEGTIDLVDEEHQKVVVIMEMFGRETETELEFSQVKPIEL